MNDNQAEQSLRCFITVPFSCSYLEQREAQNLIVDQDHPLNNQLHANLLNIGFRRSGGHLYRPQCEGCKSCVSLRIPTHIFKPNRNQKRVWKLNQDLKHHRANTEYNSEHFELYKRYIEGRHPGSSMQNPSEDEYLTFLTSPNITTHFHEFRLDGKLIAVAATDRTPQGLSAVYTFYDPELHARSLGTYAILWQIYLTQRLKLPWLYLGYWVKECEKMRYKNKFQPCEGYADGQWQDIAKLSK
ncbi:arginyltransferase [Pseudomonadota bacterium]